MISRFFKWLWKQIKKLFKTIITRTFLFLGFVFTWVIPIWMLNEEIALTEVDIAFKFTVVGLLVIVFCAIKFYGKIKEKINSMHPKTIGNLILQLILMALHKALTLTAVLFLFKYMAMFINSFYSWFSISLIPIGIGLVFYLVDKIIIYNRDRKRELQEREDLKEKIIEELGNGE